MIAEVFGSAWQIYRLLFRRSVVVAAPIFAVVSLASAFAGRRPTIAAELVAGVLTIMGSLLVQGALVEMIHDLRQGHSPASLGSYLARTRDRLGTLFAASLLAGLGVGIGFLLLVVPGLIAFARWSLIVPLVMVERAGLGEAFSRSSQLVKGRTGRVLVLIVVLYLITGVSAYALEAAFTFLPRFAAAWIGVTIASTLTVPYQADVLTVLYYRLREPDGPLLPA